MPKGRALDKHVVPESFYRMWGEEWLQWYQAMDKQTDEGIKNLRRRAHAKG